MTFADTNFFLALINDRDEHHDKAVTLAEQYRGLSLVTTDAVLLEVGNGLARGFRDEAVALFEELENSPEAEIVRLDPEIFDAAKALYKSHRDKEWGLVDCVSFIVMRERQISDALTSDKHFVQAGFRALMR